MFVVVFVVVEVVVVLAGVPANDTGSEAEPFGGSRLYGVALNLFGAVFVPVPVPDMLVVVWKRNFLLAYGVPLVVRAPAPAPALEPV